MRGSKLLLTVPATNTSPVVLSTAIGPGVFNAPVSASKSVSLLPVSSEYFSMWSLALPLFASFAT